MQAGTYDVSVTVSDGTLSTTGRSPGRLGRTRSAAVLITITPSFPPPAGQPVVLQVTASGIADMSRLRSAWTASRSSLAPRDGRLSSRRPPDHYSVIATATDVDGSVGTAMARPQDPRSQRHRLARRATHGAGQWNGALATGHDHRDRQRQQSRRLSIDVAADRRGFEFDRAGRRAVERRYCGAPLWVWRRSTPASLKTATYLLQLTATNISGRTSTISSLMEINTASTSASFSTSATDLTTTLDGVSVSFTRYYQSVAAASAGLVGNGWQLAGFDPQIAMRLVPSAAQPRAFTARSRSARGSTSIFPTGPAPAIPSRPPVPPLDR